MYEAFRKLILAVTMIWLTQDGELKKSVFYVRREDLDGDDPYEDERLAGGKIMRVTIEVADDDSEQQTN